MKRYKFKSRILNFIVIIIRTFFTSITLSLHKLLLLLLLTSICHIKLIKTCVLAIKTCVLVILSMQLLVLLVTFLFNCFLLFLNRVFNILNHFYKLVTFDTFFHLTLNLIELTLIKAQLLFKFLLDLKLHLV